MENNSEPLCFTDNHSNAIAIYNGKIAYANRTFENYYNRLKILEKNKTRQLLSQLRSELIQSGSDRLQKHIHLFPDQKETNLVVYLLNKTGLGESGMLLMASQEKPFIEFPFFNPGQSVDFDNSPKRQLSSVFSNLIGQDVKFKAVLYKAQKAAQSDYPILIKGESGTGKEILARTIHEASGRKQNNFVDINCAAIPDQLIDSELFGYEKGAFTGALPGGRHGLFEEANFGTLFLDEIGDATLPTQAKLLRVLNEGHFKKIGSNKNIEVDVRIISATNKDLSGLIEKKYFRQDLIYRLNTITINLPPLRERFEDISILANFFLKIHSEKRGQTLNFSKSCLDHLCSYHWPGNVRELKGVVDYMATMASGFVIRPNHFPDFMLPKNDVTNTTPEREYVQLKDNSDVDLLSKAVETAEKAIIKDVMRNAKNKSMAIKILGTSRRTFYSKLKRYNIR